MTSIEWTNQTWNPVTGCDPVSPGCAHCYAADVAKRFWGDRKFSDVQFHPDRLEQPLRWRKPRMVFVNSMSDLFHESVTDEQLDQIFAVMALTQQHTYQCLTKRPERMLGYCSSPETTKRIFAHTNAIDPGGKFNVIRCPGGWPFPHVWLGVTVENQRTADERIPLLLQTPAAVRFLSCEPLLEEIGLLPGFAEIDGRGEPWAPRCNPDGSNAIDWVIVGGESGPKARPCDIAWIRSIVEQCKDAEVPCFVKQLGSNPCGFRSTHAPDTGFTSVERWNFTGKGNDPDEWPEDLRVREFPPMPVNA